MLLLVGVLAVAAALPPRGATPTPPAGGASVVSADRGCRDVDRRLAEFRVDRAALGNRAIAAGPSRITIRDYAEATLSFDATIAVDAVLVQARGSQHLYRYMPSARSGRGLTGPPIDRQGLAPIERVTFCIEEARLAAAASGSPRASRPPSSATPRRSPGRTTAATSPTPPAPTPVASTPPAPTTAPTPPPTPSAPPATASPAPPAPAPIAAAATCQDVNSSWRALTVEGAALGDGAFSDGRRSVTITNYGANAFDFQAPQPYTAVIIRSGPAANVWRFDPPATQAQRLTGPSGRTISRLAFCYAP